MTFYRYLPDLGVHIVDCSGTVDFRLGLERLELLRQQLAARPLTAGVHRVLIDFRNTVWADEETHRQLSLITRQDFGLGAAGTSIRAAILHHGGHGSAGPNEHWFSSEEEALTWLTTEQTTMAGPSPERERGSS